MIYTSTKTATGCTYPAKLKLPLLIDGPPARVINNPTDQDLLDAGFYPADPFPELADNQKYSGPTFVNGRVVVTALDKTAEELAADLQLEREMLNVSPWQIRKALNYQGMREMVEQLVAGASIDIQDGWKYATEFKRLYPFVVSIGQSAGLTVEQLDNLFRLAASL